MPKLVSPPQLHYKCKCGSVSEANESEFKSLNTIPPTFLGECAFCHADVVCSPPALVAKDAVAYCKDRFGL
jgi:hypothetical protein